MSSVLQPAIVCGRLAVLAGFRREFYDAFTARRDELFELTDAVLCTDGAVKTLVELALAPEHQRGHGALYDGINHGGLDIGRLRRAITDTPLPRATVHDVGRVLATGEAYTRPAHHQKGTKPRRKG